MCYGVTYRAVAYYDDIKISHTFPCARMTHVVLRAQALRRCPKWLQYMPLNSNGMSIRPSRVAVPKRVRFGAYAGLRTVESKPYCRVGRHLLSECWLDGRRKLQEAP
jgi:hypothetical protein